MEHSRTVERLDLGAFLQIDEKGMLGERMFRRGQKGDAAYKPSTRQLEIFGPNERKGDLRCAFAATTAI